jgi:23S rRNA (guanosine2251-2'-O)-methyltransferase
MANQSTDIVIGVHSLIEVLKAKRRRLITLYTTKPLPKAWSQISPLIPKSATVQYVDKSVLTRIAGTDDHQGFVATTNPFVFRSKMFEPTKQKFLLMLDGVQDVRNVGAILRSAYCTSVDGIILIKKGGASLTPAALKASAGLAEYLEIMVMPSAAMAIEHVNKAGYAIYLAVLENGQNAAAVSYKGPACLVIGSEEKGISTDIRSSGTRITLPQRRADISYNASVAAGILLFLIGQKIHTAE